MDTVQPGQTLGAYRIISQVGQGGMAAVYKAYHAAMDRYVAVKVLPRQLAESPEFSGRFQQEARIIANLEHPHILPVYDYGEDHGISFLIMRYLEAGTLKERMQTGPLPLNEVDRLFTQLAQALDYAHSKGVIHRDLKPSNALMDARGELFLSDFGIAKLLESSSQFTGTGAMIGTPAYMSPEQAQGQKVDQRTDIYALGIILYEMVTGRVPYEAETPLAVILKHLNEPLPLPTSVKPDLSPNVERVLLKALDKNPEARFASVNEFLTAWKKSLAEAETMRPAATPPVFVTPTPTAPTVSSPVPTPPAPAAKRTPLWVWAIVGAGILLLACIGLFFVTAPGRRAAQRATETAAAQVAATTPAALATATEAALVPTAETAPTLMMPTPAAATGWTQWVPTNIIFSVLPLRERVLAWGLGGLTVWNRADGTLLQQFTTQTGLPSNLVNQVVVRADEQDMWVATEEGLLHIEGERRTLYNGQDGLDSNHISALALTEKFLFVGTKYSGVPGGGLWVFDFDKKQWSAAPDFPSAEASENPTQLSYNINVIVPLVGVDNSLAVLVGTENGVGVYDGATWTTYLTDAGLPSPTVYAITLASDKQVWVGTGAGAALFDGTRFEFVEGGPQAGVYGIVEDEQGRMWFSGDEGLMRYDPQAADWERFSRDLDNLPVWSTLGAARDAEGHVYFGSDSGILRYDGEAFTEWRAPNVPDIYGMGRIVPAPDGTLWFVEEYGPRANRYDPASDTWSTVELPCEDCRPLVFDEAGRLWLGGWGGLWRVEEDAVTLHLTTAEGLPSDVVSAIAFAPDGHVLVGTEAGVAHLDNDAVTATFTQESAGLADNNTFALFVTSDESVWVGTSGGLSRMLPDGAWEHFTAGQPFEEHFGSVREVAEANDGALWVATENGGVYRLTDGQWKQWPSDSLLSLAPGPGGTVWTGTYYHGANYFDGQQWQHFDVRDGLVYPNVVDVYVDAAGAVWFATSGGAGRYQP